MKSRYIYKFLCCLLLISGLARAQSIRKDYREFTQSEMNHYVAALNLLFSNGTITSFVNGHIGHFNSAIHTTGGFNGEQFLPWHRFFLIELEQTIRGSSGTYSYLTIPYWDWTTDQNTASSQFWNNGFLNSSNFPGWGFTRSISGSWPTTSQLNTVLGLTTFFANTTNKLTATDFSHRLEFYHDIVHVNVGGTMNSAGSPLDPIFYLHHNMVDKFWQKWEDQTTSIQASFPNGTSGMIHYSTPEYPFTVTLNNMLDSRDLTRPAVSGSGRDLDVWYAENGKVLLDGANGTPFVASDASVSYIYRYTAATSPGSTTFTGDMFVGDVARDASGNVITDNKGGFEINNAVKCNFLAGREITFKEGFWAKSGSEVVAKIISTPNETAPLQRADRLNSPIVTLIQPDRSDASTSAFKLRLFPNPVTSKAFIQYNVSTTSSVYLTVTDVSGRLLKASGRKIKEPGNYVEEIDMTDLPKGVYMCSFVIGDQKKTLRIVK
jgi:tyrosinase